LCLEFNVHDFEVFSIGKNWFIKPQSATTFVLILNGQKTQWAAFSPGIVKDLVSAALNVKMYWTRFVREAGYIIVFWD
jgi:hypothetical protein